MKNMNMFKMFGELSTVKLIMIIMIYLKAGALILADAFEKFGDLFLINHDIDPAYCYSAPGLTWKCGLKHTDINLDLLTDYEMLLMLENEIRGGYSGVLGRRYVKVKNKYVEDIDPNKSQSLNSCLSSNYLLYLDANNLYRWAMSQPLPTRDFKWEVPNNYPEGSCMTESASADASSSNYNWRNPPENRGCIIECDLEYTSNAKFQTSKFPLALEKLKIKEEELSNYQLRCLEIEGKSEKNSKININFKRKKELFSSL